jgi:iron(III) transport system ATP-binding protein
MSFLQLKSVSKRFGAIMAVDQVSLTVPAGSRTVIVGPSGSGKTTLLRLIAGFEAPDAGSIAMENNVLADGQSFIPTHRRGIGLVAQHGALFPHLSIADNIGFGLDHGADRQARILALMEMVELDAIMLHRRPHELSGGQQQRVAVARALARRPSLMLLDEPFSALDAGLREATRKSVSHVLTQAGITTILVTHDQAEALSFGDQVAVLRAGRVVQAGPPSELYFRPDDPETASFLGDVIVLRATFGDNFADCALGRVSADTAGHTGNGDIMLRPEQLRLSAAVAEGQVSLARVTAVEFGGSNCVVAVRLDGSDKPLTFRMSAFEAPEVGAGVRISVVGKAHIFDRSKA